jgi:pyruvate formate lyase activating enzyme
VNHIPNIKGFVETSFVDWRGKVCAVVFLGRCNFRCPFCHNHQLVLEPDGLQDLYWRGILETLSKHRGWIDGVCFSGGEPTLHESLGVMLEGVRDLGFLTKLDTNGSRPEVLESLHEQDLLDAVSMDVKAPLAFDCYARCAGRAVDLRCIEKSVQFLARSSLEVEFRTTVVPGLLSTGDVLELAATLPVSIPHHLQGFKPENTLESGLRHAVPLTDEALDWLRAGVAEIRKKASPPMTGAFDSIEVSYTAPFNNPPLAHLD